MFLRAFARGRYDSAETPQLVARTIAIWIPIDSKGSNARCQAIRLRCFSFRNNCATPLRIHFIQIAQCCNAAYTVVRIGAAPVLLVRDHGWLFMF